ncbi:hypothetical protein E1295_34410 [Nonomuraea mesophila]|uniref:Uncharacterized protein n=1 Tax=Nonomuraea mesophila TaxID=2530382 RepID=A0A4R5ESB4_9ACTN|nr:hypothetical protein [Nonomuraea mesophila]TDE37592.1 hypothetical protein E1295_34410 [Nonomuraea mesophila]
MIWGKLVERDDMSAEAALREVQRAQDAVRKSSRWGAHFFLATGLGSLGYWLATLLGSAAMADYAALGIGVLVVAAFVYVVRRQVYDQLVSRLSYPITGAFVGTTVVAALYNMFVHPQEPSALRVVAGVLVALVASSPLFYAAVRMLRVTDDR